MVKTTCPHIDMAATGKNIAALINNRGYKVSEIQGYLGLSAPQAIYKWQWGKTLPSVDNLLALSILLDAPIDDILVANSQDVIDPRPVTLDIAQCYKEQVSYYYLANAA